MDVVIEGLGSYSGLADIKIRISVPTAERGL
ncbi:unnamed protein product, partial [marine sediment metagenome]